MRGLVFCLIAVLALGSCKPAPENPYPGAENFGPQLLERERLACEKDGGRFAQGGLARTLVCYRTPRDAGKSCTKASDCSTQCLARSQTCAPIDPLLGCNEVLGNDGSRTTLCVD